MKKINFILQSISLVMLLQIAATAAIIYVDNQLTNDCAGTYSIANRDNSGSDGDAYNTPQEAADIVEPGDIVYFRAGTFYNHEVLTYQATVMTVLRSGTADNPITFTNYNNEKVILSGTQPNDLGHFYTVRLGEAPEQSSEISGLGVQNIIIDGLIIEGAHWHGLMIGGPADRNASAQNPTENVIVRNVIFRYNGVNSHPGGYGGSPGGGLRTIGKIVNVLIENCEAHDNQGCGISFGWVGIYEGEDWHINEPDDDMSAAQHSVIRNCLSYNNIHPTTPGNTDGLSGTHMYHTAFENNVVFNNSDDGIDIYASIGVTAKSNIVFGQSYEGGNNCGIKFSAGGGGTHIIAGNVVFNNDVFNFESSPPSNRMRPYCPSRIFGNLAYNGLRGFVLGSYQDLKYPGFDTAYLRDNIGLDNIVHDISGDRDGLVDSDYNFFSNAGNLSGMQAIGQDAHSLTGEADLMNKTVVIDTNFGADWTVRQKLDYIRSQVLAAFSPAANSQLIDKGVFIEGYHCPYADDDPVNPMDPQVPGRHWLGSAPDIGAFEIGLDPFKIGPVPDPDPDPDPKPDPDTETESDALIPDVTALTVLNNIIKSGGNQSASIRCDMKETGHLTVIIYDAKGKKIITVCDEQQEAGRHEFVWEGMDSAGSIVGSGIYLVHLKSETYSATKKIAIVK